MHSILLRKCLITWGTSIYQTGRLPSHWEVKPETLPGLRSFGVRNPALVKVRGVEKNEAR